MERGTWTDERLADRFDHIDQRFDRLDADVSDLRSEVRGGRAESLAMRAELSGRTDTLGGELRGEMQGLHRDIADLRLLMIRLYGGTIVAAVGAIAAILARGG